MRFTNSELEMIYQYAAPTKAETIGGMKETVPVIKDLLTRVIMENAIEKLQKIPEPECSRFIADNKARFLAGHENSIRRRLAEAKAQQPVMQGHDLTGMERFLPETRHMIVLDVKTSDSPVGFPGERHRYFLSDEAIRTQEQRGAGRNQDKEPCRRSCREAVPGQEAGKGALGHGRKDTEHGLPPAPGGVSACA